MVGKKLALKQSFIVHRKDKIYITGNGYATRRQRVCEADRDEKQNWPKTTKIQNKKKPVLTA